MGRAISAIVDSMQDDEVNRLLDDRARTWSSRDGRSGTFGGGGGKGGGGGSYGGGGGGGKGYDDRGGGGGYGGGKGNDDRGGGGGYGGGKGYDDRGKGGGYGGKGGGSDYGGGGGGPDRSRDRPRDDGGGGGGGGESDLSWGNTIYISGIPIDACRSDPINTFFSQIGIIKKSKKRNTLNEPTIHIYTDKRTRAPKGDA